MLILIKLHEWKHLLTNSKNWHKHWMQITAHASALHAYNALMLVIFYFYSLFCMTV